MGKFMLELDDEMHDDLRYMSIEKKKYIKDMIIEAIEKWLQKQ